MLCRLKAPRTATPMLAGALAGWAVLGPIAKAKGAALALNTSCRLQCYAQVPAVAVQSRGVLRILEHMASHGTEVKCALGCCMWPTACQHWHRQALALGMG